MFNLLKIHDILVYRWTLNSDDLEHVPLRRQRRNERHPRYSPSQRDLDDGLQEHQDTFHGDTFLGCTYAGGESRNATEDAHESCYSRCAGKNWCYDTIAAATDKVLNVYYFLVVFIWASVRINFYTFVPYIRRQKSVMRDFRPLSVVIKQILSRLFKFSVFRHYANIKIEAFCAPHLAPKLFLHLSFFILLSGFFNVYLNFTFLGSTSTLWSSISCPKNVIVRITVYSLGRS